MASSLLSQFSNSLPLVSLIHYQGVFGGDLICGSKYGGSISLLGNSTIDFDFLDSTSSSMMIGLDTEVPCLASKKGWSFPPQFQLFLDLSWASLSISNLTIGWVCLSGIL